MEEVWNDFEQLGIPVVSGWRVQSLEEAERAAEALRLPVLLSTGRAFAMRVDHSGDLPLAWAKAEKVCPGRLKRIQAVVAGESCRVLGFQLRRDFFAVEVLGLGLQEGPFPVPMAMVAPVDLSSRVYGEALEIARKVCRAAMPPTGPVELDFIFGGSGLVLNDLHSCDEIDPMAARLLELSLGIDLSTAAEDIAASRYPDLTPRRSLGAACVWLDGTSGVMERVEGEAEARAVAGVIEVAIKMQPGDTLGHITTIGERDKIGWIIAVAPTAAAALMTVAQAKERLRIVINKMLDG